MRDERLNKWETIQLKRQKEVWSEGPAAGSAAPAGTRLVSRKAARVQLQVEAGWRRSGPGRACWAQRSRLQHKRPWKTNRFIVLLLNFDLL